LNTIPQKTVLAIILAFGAGVTACTTTAAPFAFTDTFNVSSNHYREIKKEPWEIIGNTDYRIFPEHDEEIIHIRGRERLDEDKKDIFDSRVRKPDKEWFPGAEGIIKIHYGFLRQYTAIRSVLLDTINQYPDYAIRISGYSLGGTWTQLFLLDAILHWPDRDILAILYAPANPWRKLPKKYQEELEQRTVFVCNHWDPVTWMRVIGFYRYGYNIKIGKWWRCLPAQHKGAQMTKALDEKFPNVQREE